MLAGDSLGFGEVDLVCTLNRDGSLDPGLDRLRVKASHRPAHAAALACLGSTDGRARTLKALASPREDEVQIAQAYLRHRPITDGKELRDVAFGIARMKGSGAQVRALEALAPTVAAVVDPVVRAHYVQKMARMAQVDERTVLALLNRGRTARPAAEVSTSSKPVVPCSTVS